MIEFSQINLIKEKINRLEKYPIRTIYAGVLAGMFISIGALLMSVAKTEGCNKIICGMMFSCGLFFVVITGTELFTGNCMIKGLLIDDKEIEKIKITKLLFNNYFSNCIGAIIMFFIVAACNIDCSALIDMAVNKYNSSIFVTFIRGYACNVLVCFAIWISVYIEPTKSKIERFIAVLFPVTVFVACGFEHSIANMFILPFGLLSGNIDILQVVVQLALVTFGNYCGGLFMGVLINGTTRYC